jgi:hypothetical protein
MSVGWVGLALLGPLDRREGALFGEAALEGRREQMEMQKRRRRARVVALLVYAKQAMMSCEWKKVVGTEGMTGEGPRTATRFSM